MSAIKKLSCVRCKEKKLKCDRLVPCARCKVADAVCVTAERKPRAKTKGAVDSLNLRIDVLEKAIQSALEQPPVSPESRAEPPTPTPATTSSSRPSADLDHSRDQSLAHVTASSNSRGPDTEGWVGNLKEVWTAMSSSMDNVGVNHASKSEPRILNAIDALDGAIGDLDTFADVHYGDYATSILSKEEARKAVSVALELFGGELFLPLLDRDFASSFADVIHLPAGQADPAARVVYYCLVFHGHIVSQYKSSTAARTLYLQCLEAVPNWQATASGTLMDVIAACCLCWTCIVSSDGRLSWEFHSKACQYVKGLGLHRLDVLTARGIRESSIQNEQRGGFWQLVLIDLMYRLGYDKPSAISAEASLKSVQRPEVADIAHQQPRASQNILYIVWGRIIFIVKTFFEYWDAAGPSNEMRQSEELQAKLENLADQIHDLMVDWRIVALMRANSDDSARSWTYADLLIGAYGCIGQMERIRTGGGHAVSDRSLKASRTVLDTIAEFHQLSTKTRYPAIYMYSLAFYPFHAFFALYYNIIGGSREHEFQDDIARLEKLGALMVQASRTRFEYVPIAKAITSLNQITRYVHRARSSSDSQHMWTTTPGSFDTAGAATPAAETQTALGTGLAVTDASSDFQSTDFVHLLPPFQGAELTSTEDFQNIINDAHFEPMSYMRALEDQFVGKHANYGGWWNGGVPAP